MNAPICRTGAVCADPHHSSRPLSSPHRPPHRVSLSLLVILGVTACLLSTGWATESFVPGKIHPRLTDPNLKELSGAASSQSHPSFLWALNDSGNSPALYLMDDLGRSRGQVLVTGAPNIDWEDLAGFDLEGRPYLLIADTGDNAARRKICSLHVVPEPDTEPGRVGGTIHPAWTIPVRYEDGPRDCEAVAVDARAGEIFLISKRTWPQVLYGLPLRPMPSEAPVVARRRGIVNLPKADPWEGPYASQSTGLDFNPQGDLAAVLTYARVFLFHRRPGETWPQAFARKPERLRRHGLEQAEALAFSSDGQSIHVLSEGAGSPVVIYKKRDQ